MLSGQLMKLEAEPGQIRYAYLSDDEIDEISQSTPEEHQH